MKFTFTALTALLTLLPSLALAKNTEGSLSKSQIKSIVTFGDSYTDTFWITNGGVQWPTYVARYAGITNYPYARSGATCSNNLTYRPFPPLFESQIPTFLGDKKNGTINVDPNSTLYTLWLGTNDIGMSSLLTGDNDASIVDVAGCLVNWVQVMYDNGARNFLFQNIVPLEKTPVYSSGSWPNRYWHLERNTTAWSVSMRELVLGGNALTKLMLQDLAPKLQGAHIGRFMHTLHAKNNGCSYSDFHHTGIFDSHSLFTDMYAHPADYLNGTAALNVTGSIDSCIYQTGDSDESVCTMVNGTDRDSYLWYDELHPSEQADRHVAREIANVILGKGSRWVSWLS
ncbi:carbohydrate esterase family 16 protein [Macrolepiota fuliginosa MF-IS2]|uniref:Carbohydrate esterase family 16 protein n=1 Tax=Macrolepiota fuliginosa MF-IS2 TaxID=1400762 RepID=A0A9P6C6P5_9AGAR|nr:carbohydrate esterase family 16 protein [Macrolepiota fuliginosa MF-IS2]